MKRRLCLPDRVPRESSFGRLVRHFHEHPQGRLHEILFWGGIGLAMGAFAFFGWRADWLSTPIALMLGVVAACFLLWAMLPQRKSKGPPKVIPGKRGEIARERAQIKAKHKQKENVPPGPPLRRG